jgi:WD40 repeat protein
MITNLVFPESNAFALLFSPHGNVLACGASASNRAVVLKLWAAAGWREISLAGMNLQGLGHGDFSPDERTLAVGYSNGTAAWWDIATGQRRAFFDCHYAGYVQVAFSPDGRLFATGGFDGRLTVWDVATQRPKAIGRGYRNALHQLVFSPDSQRLVASGSTPKGVVKVWDVETGRDVATLPGEPGWYSRIGFSPDGNTLFAASQEGTALFWHAPSFAEIERLEKERAGAK